MMLKKVIPLENNKYTTFVIFILYCTVLKRFWFTVTHMIGNPTDAQFKNDQMVIH